MNILFLTLLDFSSVDENGIYTDLMREFIKNNHKVYIISPSEKRRKQPTKLIDNGNHKILKLQIGNIQKTNAVEKGISTLTLESKFKKAIRDNFSDVKFDLVIYSTPPITLRAAIKYVKKRDTAKTYLLLKDIFPQNAVDLGMLTKTGVKSPLYYYFRKKEKKLYELSDYIGCMSEANKAFILKHNPKIRHSNIEICPNSIEIKTIAKTTKHQEEIRAKYGIPMNKTIFIYGGNLGKPQGVDFLVQCLKANSLNKEVFFIITGSGTEYNVLEKYMNEEKPPHAKLFDYIPKNDYQSLVNSCDVGLIFLDRRFTIPNFPSRLLSYMEASIPVLAATDVNTDIGQVIEQGSFGFWCESGDVEGFNKKVNQLCSEDLRTQMGSNARAYLEENYTSKHSYEIIMSHFD
ncbi:MAG: glycosyltransferase family 4 protein [Bacillus sp. (in: firmicutes)]